MYCNKAYQQKFDEQLKERFFYIYKFSNHDNDKCILLLQKGVYPFEYMDDWEKFNETTLPEKENFYSHLNMEDITDKDYAYAKLVCKDFEIKNLGEVHDLHVQSNNLLLPTVKPPTEPTQDVAPELIKHKKPKLKLQQEFTSEIIADQERYK